MALEAVGRPLRLVDRETPRPAPGQILVRISACGVCRTDLHVIDNELPHIHFPIVPGHEIVGRVEALGAGVSDHRIGARVGVPWLARTCGTCSYCLSGRENLCDSAEFTGYTVDGGYADHVLAGRLFRYRGSTSPLRRADRLPVAENGG